MPDRLSLHSSRKSSAALMWRWAAARQCGRRVHGRHPLQTSDALGPANVQPGPSMLRARFGLHVTAGGLAKVLQRGA